ncbi:MAG: hypothetical protein ACRDJK_12600 [Actinomycetota bacterium]
MSLRLQWEWRDWKPGSELGLRACTDLDGRQEVDGKATPPHQGPQFDFKTIHPAEPPERRAEEKNRRVVTHTVTLQVPGDASPGEFCTRVAVAGDPQAHRGSAPPFDIAETVCLPIAASAVSSDPGPPARTVSPPKVLPVTGGPYGRLVSLALGLLIVGLSLKSRASRNRKGAGDRSRGPGWKAPTRPR